MSSITGIGTILLQHITVEAKKYLFIKQSKESLQVTKSNGVTKITLKPNNYLK
ncbi:hypothetical protein SDC9_92524 [bioreactor metagenome]|uniref:Uncharacterized protein n=1 Tax=bioreactor metagenome TaxID=1076179 RepID=A0A644ZYD5_9ZZZZ